MTSASKNVRPNHVRVYPSTSNHLVFGKLNLLQKGSFTVDQSNICNKDRKFGFCTSNTSLFLKRLLFCLMKRQIRQIQKQVCFTLATLYYEILFRKKLWGSVNPRKARGRETTEIAPRGFLGAFAERKFGVYLDAGGAAHIYTQPPSNGRCFIPSLRGERWLSYIVHLSLVYLFLMVQLSWAFGLYNQTPLRYHCG